MSCIKELLLYPNQIRDRFEEAYSLATENEVIEAASWYTHAASFCSDVGLANSKPFIQISGLCSAMSPRKHWDENKSIVKHYFKGRYKHNKVQVAKAHQIMETTSFIKIMEILHGKKTMNFFGNIYNPQDERFITIDVHILTLGLGQYCTDVTPNQYERIKKILLEMAKEKKEIGSNLQSLLWIVQKRINNEQSTKEVKGPF